MMDTIPASWVMQSEAETTLSSNALLVSMEVKDVLQALEYTSQLNRRLQAHAQYDASHDTMIKETSTKQTLPSNCFRGGGTCTVRVPVDDTTNDDTTIFQSRPDEPLLHIVLQRALHLIPERAHQDMVLALALVYLDRACSVETSRALAPPCPYCAPATIRRLFLSAFLIAARANGIDPDFTKVQESFGVSRCECEEMMAAMMAALGDSGVFVTPEEMQSFSFIWKTRFPTSI